VKLSAGNVKLSAGNVKLFAGKKQRFAIFFSPRLYKIPGSAIALYLRTIGDYQKISLYLLWFIT